jgi:hypothetical protein
MLKDTRRKIPKPAGEAGHARGYNVQDKMQLTDEEMNLVHV